MLGHLVRFARALRLEGVLVTPDQVAVFAEALGVVSPTDQGAFHAAARATLVCRHEDLAVFERVFAQFFATEVAPPRQELLSHAPAPQARQPPPAEAGRPPPAATREPDAPPTLVSERAMTYSPGEVLRHKHFDVLSDEEQRVLQDFILRFAWQTPLRRTRRLEPHPRGTRFDLRRTLRRALQQGGEVTTLYRRHPRVKPRALVVFLDISGSMERYARVLLMFLFALAKRRQHPLEVFVFGTRLTRVTPALGLRSVDSALARVGQEAQDWSGGTRIGASLAAFRRDHAKRVLRRGAVVLLLSDGWDQGEPALLTQEMARLQRLSHRVVWLNPLLGTPGYEPLTRGMQAALPFVDDFLPVHNLDSLGALARHLERLPTRRPVRS